MNKEIATWLNKQHVWLQEAAHRLLTNGALSQTDIVQLAKLIKNPEPVSGTSRSYPSIGTGTAKLSELKLVSIGPVNGIEALSPRLPLEFGTGNLTLIYGMNGSGKSGYSRIIRKACGKPNSADLKPDVYKEPPMKRSCAFKYRIDKEDKPAEWLVDDEPIGDLATVDVFDADTGQIYLEQETELSFDPPELALFANLVGACSRVEAHLTGEQNKLTSHLPDRPASYRGTEAGIAYQNLRHDLDDRHLDELLSWTPTNESELTSHLTRLNAPDLTVAAKKRREVKTQIDAIRRNLGGAIAVLGYEQYETLRELKESSIAARKAAKEGARALGETARLDGIGDDTWRKMWEAAREYSTGSAYPNSSFPYTGDNAICVLCQQDLGEEARTRLTDFENYVKGKLETAAKRAELDLQQRLAQIPTRPSLDSLQTAYAAAELAAEIGDKVEISWNTLEKQLAVLRSGVIRNELPKIDGASTRLLEELTHLSDAAEEAAKKFDADSKTVDRTATQSQKLELDAKKWVTQQAVAVRAEIVRLTQVEEYREWIRRTTTTGLSVMSAKLSKKLITEAYIDRFNDELKQLGATKIQVQLVRARTIKGVTKHSIQLRDLVHKGARVADVLSEGERRIVALAAYLADVTGRESKSPFVFDDPISSLDQIFEEKVIARLVALSKDRQVLVFTHRLSFLGIMNTLAGDNLVTIQIQREPWGTGNSSTVPPYGKKPDKALNNLKNDRIPKARRVFENEGYDAYYPYAKSICTDFRILMERIVETVFLADVVQRHRREIQTKGKMEKLLRITDSDCALIDEMMTKYSSFEHSQSDEAPGYVPEPDEIEKDIDRMVEWHDEFSKRPVKGAVASM